ncbi:MAG TPA: hypothetical protein VFC50_01625 [Candidatus Dormibacteraeota bacterium]|nr:hypothetical protein [Candidatus Dormibacteraeota bacterium]
MLKHYLSNRTENFQRISLVLIVLIVAGVGTYLIISSRAASPYENVDASGGTTNGATAQTCTGSTAGNGQCVVFGGQSSGPVSKAVCNPSPCTQGTLTSSHVTVDDGAGSSLNRLVQFYRPQGLTNSPSNQAPLVVLYNVSDLNNTTIPQQNWESLANQDHFLVVSLTNQWTQPPGCNTSYATPVAFPLVACENDCGPSQTGVCDDTPYINAALDSLVTTQNVDQSLIYATGGSKGGSMTEETMCDPAMSSRFAGFAPISAVFISPSTNNDPSVLPNCPALSSHKNFSVQYQFGTSDNAYSGNLATGFVNAKNEWLFSQTQNLTNIINPALGCSNTPTTSTLFGSSNNIMTVYGNCTTAGISTSVVQVNGGGHTYSGLDGVNGFDSALESWTFWTSNAPFNGP